MTRRQIGCQVCLSVFKELALDVSPTRGASQWQLDAEGQLLCSIIGACSGLILFCLFYFVMASIRKTKAVEIHLSTRRRKYPDIVTVLGRQPFMSSLLRDVEVEDPP